MNAARTLLSGRRRSLLNWFKAHYTRRLIASAESDIQNLEADYKALPAMIKSYQDYTAEMRVELAVLEQKSST